MYNKIQQPSQPEIGNAVYQPSRAIKMKFVQDNPTPGYSVSQNPRPNYSVSQDDLNWKRIELKKQKQFLNKKAIADKKLLPVQKIKYDKASLNRKRIALRIQKQNLNKLHLKNKQQQFYKYKTPTDKELIGQSFQNKEPSSYQPINAYENYKPIIEKPARLTNLGYKNRIGWSNIAYNDQVVPSTRSYYQPIPNEPNRIMKLGSKIKSASGKVSNGIRSGIGKLSGNINSGVSSIKNTLSGVKNEIGGLSTATKGGLLAGVGIQLAPTALEAIGAPQDLVTGAKIAKGIFNVPNDLAREAQLQIKSAPEVIYDTFMEPPKSFWGWVDKAASLIPAYNIGKKIYEIADEGFDKTLQGFDIYNTIKDIPKLKSQPMEEESPQEIPEEKPKVVIEQRIEQKNPLETLSGLLQKPNDQINLLSGPSDKISQNQEGFRQTFKNTLRKDDLMKEFAQGESGANYPYFPQGMSHLDQISLQNQMKTPILTTSIQKLLQNRPSVRQLPFDYLLKNQGKMEFEVDKSAPDYEAMNYSSKKLHQQFQEQLVNNDNPSVAKEIHSMYSLAKGFNGISNQQKQHITDKLDMTNTYVQQNALIRARQSFVQQQLSNLELPSAHQSGDNKMENIRIDWDYKPIEDQYPINYNRGNANNFLTQHLQAQDYINNQQIAMQEIKQSPSIIQQNNMVQKIERTKYQNQPYLNIGNTALVQNHINNNMQQENREQVLLRAVPIHQQFLN